MNRISQPAIILVCAIAACILVGSSVLAADSPRTVKIVYTNDTLGYLEPCGCGGRMQGGLARRTTAIADILKADANVVILDSGNISNMSAKMSLVASAMAAMKYDAIGMGGSDRLFSEEFFKQTASVGLKVIDSTVPASASTIAYLIKKVGGVKVGVVSFGKATSTPGDSKIGDLTTFYKSYKTAREASEILVLLDQGNIAKPEWLEGEAAKLGVNTRDIAA